jgi:hypothetical protein
LEITSRGIEWGFEPGDLGCAAPGYWFKDPTQPIFGCPPTALSRTTTDNELVRTDTINPAGELVITAMARQQSASASHRTHGLEH